MILNLKSKKVEKDAILHKLITLDTNVLVSGMLNPSSPPGQILNLIISRKLQIVVDDRIMIEYFDVLGRDKFKKYFSEYDRENVKAYLRNSSLRVTADEVVSDLPDPGDIPFLEVALTMDVPLVSGNLRHFPVSKRCSCVVLSPREFIDTINKER